MAPGIAGFQGVLWGLLGSILCTLAVVLPPYILCLYASHFITRHKESAYVKGVFSGLRPVVVGLIASAALLLMNSANFGTESRDVIISIAICVASFCTVYFTKIHPIAVIVAAGIAGLFLF